MTEPTNKVEPVKQPDKNDNKQAFDMLLDAGYDFLWRNSA